VVAVLALNVWALVPARSASPLGTVTLAFPPDPAPCPTGYTCQAFTVSGCPGVQPINGYYADRRPATAARGTVMFFSGGAGTGWWAETVRAMAMLDELVADGFRVVQVRWTSAWQFAAAGVETGLAALACRAATVVAFGHANLYTDAGTGPGVCGFCISGQSNGSSQVAYALAFHGLDTVVDGLFPTSGPTYAELAKGCLGEAGYDYVVIGGTNAIDRAYGFFPPGPCASHLSSYQARWLADGLVTGGSDYVWPATRVHIVEGSDDEYYLHAVAFRNRLVTAGQPVTFEEIPNMGHPLNAAGFAALRAALNQGGGPGTTTTTVAPTTTTTPTGKTTTTSVTGKTTTTTTSTGKTTTTVPKTTTTLGV
jgi:acetyl esterase/lipase